MPTPEAWVDHAREAAARGKRFAASLPASVTTPPTRKIVLDQVAAAVKTLPVLGIGDFLYVDVEAVLSEIEELR